MSSLLFYLPQIFLMFNYVSGDFDLFQNWDEDLFIVDTLSLCLDAQPSKLRVRNAACPNVLDVPLDVPDLSNMLYPIGEEEWSSDDLRNEVSVGGSLTGAQNQCLWGTKYSDYFKIPVCGSGHFMDVRVGRAYYDYVHECTLSKAILSVLRQTASILSGRN
jgi:hypothetical protein